MSNENTSGAIYIQNNDFMKNEELIFLACTFLLVGEFICNSKLMTLS